MSAMNVQAVEAWDRMITALTKSMADNEKILASPPCIEGRVPEGLIAAMKDSQSSLRAIIERAEKQKAALPGRHL